MAEAVIIKLRGRPGAPLRAAEAGDMADLHAWQQGLSEELARRANLVLAMLDGMPVREAADRCGVNHKTAYKWRTRWNRGGVKGLMTKQWRMNNDKDSFIQVSLRRSIEQLVDPDIGFVELKQLVLQLARDQPRDDPNGTSCVHSKMKLQCLALLKTIIVSEKSGKTGKQTLAEILAQPDL